MIKALINMLGMQIQEMQRVEGSQNKLERVSAMYSYSINVKSYPI